MGLRLVGSHSLVTMTLLDAPQRWQSQCAVCQEDTSMLMIYRRGFGTWPFFAAVVPATPEP
jgi:hypothetical protein